MRVEAFFGLRAISGLRADWSAVYAADAEAQFFLSFDWLFGTAAGAGRHGFVLAVRAPGNEGAYAAFMPLRRATVPSDDGFCNELDLCGNYSSDYTGFICHPAYEQTAIPALAAALQEMHWRTLRLLNFAASPRRQTLFLEGFDAGAVEIKPRSMVNPDKTDNAICPHALLTADWERFLRDRLSANTRQKVRRFLRRVEEDDDYRITETTGATLDRDIDILMRFWAARWGKNKGTRLAAIQRSQRRLLRHAFETGRLYLPVLWYREAPVCALAIFDDPCKRACYFYAAGRDQAFTALPTGLVMHAHAIRRAIGLGFDVYDFLRGNETYKYSLAGGERQICSVEIRTRSGRNLGDRLDPRSLGFVAMRCGALWREGSLAAARRGFEQIAEADPARQDARYLAGVAAARLGDHRAAIAAFEAVAGSRHQSVKLSYRLARLYRAEGHWQAAAESLFAMLEQNRGLGTIWRQLGEALLRLNRPDHAILAFDTALRRGRHDADARAGLLAAIRLRAMGAAAIPRRQSSSPASHV